MPIKLPAIKILVPFGVAAFALGACSTFPTLPDRYAQAYDQCDQNAGICYTSCQSYTVEQGRLECQSDCSATADQCFADVSAWAERESQYRAQQSFAFYGQYGAWYPHRGYYYGPHRNRYTYAPWRQPGYSSGYGYGGGGYYGSGGGGHPTHPDHPRQPDQPGNNPEPRVSDPKPDYGVGGRDRPRLPESELDLNPQVGSNANPKANPRPRPQPPRPPQVEPSQPNHPPATRPRPTPKPIPQKRPKSNPSSQPRNPKSDRRHRQEK
jgi:hypothetical protein